MREDPLTGALPGTSRYRVWIHRFDVDAIR